jgi:hypothetical protein
MIRHFARVAAFCCATSLLNAQAATDIVVTTTNNSNSGFDGQCSLGEALDAANDRSTYHECVVGGGGPPYRVVLQPGAVYTVEPQFYSHGGYYGTSFASISGKYDISKYGVLTFVPPDVEIVGNGATIQRSPSAQKFRLLQTSNGTLTLRDLTLKGGDITADARIPGGGGVFVGYGTLNLDRVTFDGNAASYGAAVYASINGAVNVHASTIVRSTGYGAIAVVGDRPVNIANSTFADNSNGDFYVSQGVTSAVSFTHNTFGGRILVFHDGDFVARGNVFGACSVDNAGATTGSYNIGPGTCGVTAAGLAEPLEPVQDNGGPGETMAFVVPSQLQDFDATCTYVSTGTNPLFANGARVMKDQRGVVRGSSGSCDAGAYEESFIRMNAALLPAPQGMGYSSPLAGTGSTGPYSFSLVDGPEWLSVTSSGPNYSLVGLVPPAGHGTSFPIILRTEDANGFAGFGTYTVSISAGLPTAPTLTSTSLDEGTNTMTVNFTPPADDGGSPITGYLVRCTTPFQSAPSATSPIVFTVPTGTNYNCGVVALNLSGSGPGSSATFGMSQGFAVVTSLTRPAPEIIGPNQRAAFDVTFSRPVTQVSADDFQVVATGTLSNNNIIDVTGSGTTYQVGVNTGTGGFGSLTLDFKDIDSVFDSSLVPVAGPGIGGGDFAGPTYVVASPPSAPTLTNVFAGSLYGAVAVSYTASNSNGSPILRYEATCNPGARTASTEFPTQLQIEVPVTMGEDYTCSVKAINAAGTSAPSGTMTASTIGTGINFIRPAAWSLNPAQPGSTVQYLVQFNHPVTGVDVSDFQLFTTGLTGATIESVAGSGLEWIVTVFAGSGTGTLRIDNFDDDSIIDTTGGPLNGVGTGPGSSGETFFVNHTPSEPTLIGAVGSDSQVAIVFDPPLSDGGLPIIEYEASCGANSGGPVRTIRGPASPIILPLVNGWNYVCSLVAYNSEGAGLPSDPFEVDLPATNLVGINRANPDPAYGPTVAYTVTFTNPVFGVDAADFAVATTGLTGASITSVTGSGETRTVVVNRGTGTGTLRLDLVFDGSITDAGGATVPFNAVEQGETYTILDAPQVTSFTVLGPTTTTAGEISFPIVFSTAVLGVDISDFALTTTHVTGASITEVFGSSHNWFVTVNTGSGSGTIRVDLVDNDSISNGSVPLGGPGAGNGNASSPVITMDRGPLPTPPTRADFNDDGTGDLVLQHADGTVAMWLMDGLANVGSSTILGSGTGWSVAQIADLDGDGKADLVWQNTDGSVAVYTMEGLTPTATAQILNAGDWTVTQAADLDGDGKADLVFQNADGTLAAWLMNGTAMSSGATLLGAGSGWSITHTGDFDGDGKADLVFTHTDGRAAIWLMNGLTPTTQAQILNAGSGWTVTHVADLDGDGNSDIVWHNADGRTAVWLMEGAAMASGAEVIGAGTGWSVTRTGDFDGDGKGDLLFTHADGRVAIYLMDGLAPATTTQILNAGSGWSAKRVSDVDGDGKADIVWEHTDGRVAIWLMDGTSVVSGTEVIGAGSGWTVSAVGQ